MAGKILEIYLALSAGSEPILVESIEVEANRGVVGDRYYNKAGTFSEKLEAKRKSEITFIAAEEIDQCNATQETGLGYGDVRRNVVTQGVDLGALIGQEFSINGVRFHGIERCEPCSHLAKTVHEKVLPGLVHTGLRAAVLTSGAIEKGQELTK